MAKTEYTQSGKELTRQEGERGKIARELKTHGDFLQARLQRLSQWVTAGLRPEALIRFALLDLQQSEKLRQCDPASIYLALLACAQTGLEPGALKGEAYLVPFARRAQFMAGYKGMIKMARRSREVRSLGAEVVRERDAFELMLGSEPRIIHKPLIGDRGLVIGAYSVAGLAHGAKELEWMDATELDKIKRVAEQRGKSPAWKDWESEMQRKSVIRRLCKRLPLGQDYLVATAIEQRTEDGEDTAARDVIDALTDGEASRAENEQERGREMSGEAGEVIDTTEAQQ